MRFDELGLPIESSATDKQDSARLAGLMTVVEWPQKIDLIYYCLTGYYRRHPKEYIYDFSRDQLVCLLAGLRKSNRNSYWLTLKANGKDFIPPSVNGLRTHKPTFIQRLWAKADVIAHALFTPLSESNQVICIADAYGLLPLWIKLNKRWRESVTIYWVTSRDVGEPELAEHIIKYVEAKLPR